MKTLGNIIWLVFGGLEMALAYFVSGILLMITIIGIPFGLQIIKIGLLALWPFGSKILSSQNSSGCLSLFMNVLWFFIGGFWLSLGHLALGILFCITIIGIPFGKQHFKLTGLALFPFGKEIHSLLN